MENEKPDNEKKKPERVIKCELCSELFSLEEAKARILTGTVPANYVFEPFICEPCYQGLDF